MKRNAAVVSVVLLGLLAGWVSAEVKPANIFQDHMVLQCDRPLTIWGTAAGGEKVAVAFGDQSVETTAGDDGKWKVELKALKASTEPAVLTIGDKKINDVLVGEVWLCSGQSNMGFTVKGVKDSAKEIADAKNHPTIRLCKVANTTSAEGPKDDAQITWAVCNSDTVGGFTAVGYFFGRELSEKPVEAVWSLAAAHGRLHAGVQPAGFFVCEDGGETWRECAALREHPTRDVWNPGAAGPVDRGPWGSRAAVGTVCAGWRGRRAGGGNGRAGLRRRGCGRGPARPSTRRGPAR